MIDTNYMKLKPCPFCGGEAKAVKEIFGTCWKVKCKKCSCNVGRSWFWNKNYAICAWNTRDEKSIRERG